MSEQLKVLEVFGEPIQNGGQESFVFNVLNHMDLSDLSVDVLTPYQCENSKYEKIIKDLGGRIISFGLPFQPGKSRGDIYRPLDQFLKNNQYDIIHIHSGSISVLAFASLAARKNHIRKIIVHSHCAAEKATMKYRLVKTIMTPILNNCPTDYCACSEVAAEWKFSKKAQDKAIIIKNGVDLEEFRYSSQNRKKIRKKYNIAESAYVIGHVGRFSYQKNHAFLLDVFNQFLKTNSDTILMLLGEGELFEETKQKAKELNIIDCIRFCGTTDNIAEYYSAMDVFVLPSRYEGLPIVGVEAQANGLQLIVSDKVSDELAITHLLTYLSIDSADCWTAALQERKSLSRTDAREILQEKGYDIKKTAQALEGLYKKRDNMITMRFG